MNIDTSIICVFLGGILGLQGWMLLEIVSLKTKVAVLSEKINEP